MKKTMLFITLMAVFATCVLANVTPFSDIMDELIFTDLRIAAVTTDMDMWLIWLSDEKKDMKEVSIKAIADLGNIKEAIENLNLPDDLKNLRTQELEVVNKLQGIYGGVEKKDQTTLKEEFASLQEIYGKFESELKLAIEKYRSFNSLPDGFDPVSEESKLAANAADRSIYLKASGLIKERKHWDAYQLLLPLKEKYKNTAFGSCVLLRISDCANSADSDMQEYVEKPEDGLEILAGIVNTDKYLPVLFEAFYKWRTIDQSYNHGMSNMSEIPNAEYNQKRWKLIQLIKSYLAKNPNDIWAQSQIDQLLALPNIERGGSMGNDNLVHWGVLFTDVEKNIKKDATAEKVNK